MRRGTATRRLSRSRRLVFSCLPTLVLVLGLEVGLRVFEYPAWPGVEGALSLGPEEEVTNGWGEQEEVRTLHFYGVESTIRSDGYHAAHLPPPGSIDRDQPLVVVVGDSFVFGIGVQRTEQLDVQLASHLTDHAGGTRAWRVLNLGRPGANIADYEQAISSQIPVYRPDAVLVFVNLSDFDRSALLTGPAFRKRQTAGGDQEDERSEGLPRRDGLEGRSRFRSTLVSLREVLLNSRSVVLCYDLVRPLEAYSRRDEWYAEVFEPDNPYLRSFPDRLRRMDQVVRASGGRLEVVLFPHFFPDPGMNEISSYRYESYHSQLEEVVRGEGISYFDTLAILQQGSRHIRVDELYIHRDGHPTGAFFHLIVPAMAREVLKLTSRGE